MSRGSKLELKVCLYMEKLHRLRMFNLENNIVASRICSLWSFEDKNQINYENYRKASCSFI